jgi:hypothetical protein
MTEQIRLLAADDFIHGVFFLRCRSPLPGRGDDASAAPTFAMA